MINLGRVSTQTRGANQLPQFYEEPVLCAVGGFKIRAGSPCDL